MKVTIIDWSGMSQALQADYSSHKARGTEYEVIDNQGSLFVLSPSSNSNCPRHNGMTWYLRADGKHFSSTFTYPKAYTKTVLTPCDRCNGTGQIASPIT